MWALIAFISLGVVVAALIEINERVKAKKNRDHEIAESQDHEDCTDKEACTDCGLAEACTKRPTAEP